MSKKYRMNELIQKVRKTQWISECIKLKVILEGFSLEKICNYIDQVEQRIDNKILLIEGRV